MNLFVIGGRLVADPILKKTSTGVPVLKFRIAHNRRHKDKEQTSFFECEAWDTGAELIAKHFKKGNSIYLEGFLRQDEWEKDGVKRSAVVLRVEHFDFPLRDREENRSFDGGRADQSEDEAPSYGRSRKKQPAGVQDDDSIPF